LGSVNYQYCFCRSQQLDGDGQRARSFPASSPALQFRSGWRWPCHRRV